MLAQLQDTWSKWHLRLTSLTLSSRVLHSLGCWIVAKPSDIQQADGFWLDNEERPIPSEHEYLDPKIQMAQVAGEWFRRRLRRDLVPYTVVLSLVMCVLVFGAGKAAVALVTKDSGTPAMVPVGTIGTDARTVAADKCDELKQKVQAMYRYYGAHVTEDQLAPGDRRVLNEFTANCPGVSR